MRKNDHCGNDRSRFHCIWNNCLPQKSYFWGHSSKTCWRMRSLHYKISCFILQLHLQPQDQTILMTLGLQNHIQTSAMPRIISRKIYSNCFYKFAIVRTTDTWYSFIHITATVKSCNHDNAFTLILPQVLLCLPLHLSH